MSLGVLVGCLSEGPRHQRETVANEGCRFQFNHQIESEPISAK